MPPALHEFLYFHGMSLAAPSNILLHGKCATRKTFPDSGTSTENARPEKSFPPLGASSKNARPEKNKSTNNQNPCYEKLKKQKEDLPAFRGCRRKCATRKKNSGVQGRHRKCATRKKTILRSGAATENCRPENNKTTSSAINNATKKMRDQKNAFWRSVATTDNARPEKHCCVQRWPPKVRDQKNNILAFKGCHFKCPTRNKDNEQRKQTCMRKCATRKKQNNEQPKHLLRKTARPETRHSGVQRWPPEMRDQLKKNIPAFRGGHRNCATRKKHSRGQVRPPKMRDQKNTRPRASETKTLRKKMRDQKNNILAFIGEHRQRATRRTFLRSEVAIESSRSEKQRSGVQGRPSQLPDQKQKQRAAETTLNRKMRDQKQQDNEQPKHSLGKTARNERSIACCGFSFRLYHEITCFIIVLVSGKPSDRQNQRPKRIADGCSGS